MDQAQLLQLVIDPRDVPVVVRGVHEDAWRICATAAELLSGIGMHAVLSVAWLGRCASERIQAAMGVMQHVLELCGVVVRKSAYRSTRMRE